MAAAALADALRPPMSPAAVPADQTTVPLTPIPTLILMGLELRDREARERRAISSSKEAIELLYESSCFVSPRDSYRDSGLRRISAPLKGNADVAYPSGGFGLSGNDSRYNWSPMLPSETS